jgi:hypothetical protein
MAHDDKTKSKSRGSPSPAKSGPRAAGAAGPVPFRRRASDVRALTRVELETLRSRLQKKFH